MDVPVQKEEVVIERHPVGNRPASGADIRAGEEIPLSEFCQGEDEITRQVIEHGGLFPFTKAYAGGEVRLPPPATPKRPMNIAEKILAAHVVGAEPPVYVKPGDAVCVRVDGGYSHEFTTAQVHHFLEQEYGPEYTVADASKFAVFEDHLVYADGVPRMAPFAPKIQALRDKQREFQRRTGVQDYTARNGVSPGICHSVARERIVEPGDLILTGTPAGVGFARKPPEFLTDGDVVECEVERIGVLRNPVKVHGHG